VSTIEEAVASLEQALTQAGLRQPAPAKTAQDLESVARAVAPWRIPHALHHFWSKFDPGTVPVYAPIQPVGAEQALKFWQSSREGQQPMNFLLIAYESHQCLAIELNSTGADGPCWYWYLVDGGFTYVASSLTQWIDTQAEMLIDGCFDRIDGGWAEDLYDVAALDDQAYRERTAKHLGLTGADALPSVSREPEDWPELWAVSRPRPAASQQAHVPTQLLSRLAQSGSGGCRFRVVRRGYRSRSMSSRSLLRLQTLLNWWAWPVRVVALVVLLGIHGPVRWAAAGILGISAVVDLGVWFLERRQRTVSEHC
jgi:hypothetical protein